jgi:PAS domain S-box-containing protein
MPAITPVAMAPSLVLIGLAGLVGYLSRERQESEAALRTSETRLRLALDGAQLGEWEWDVGTGQLHLSTRVREMFGLQPGGSVTIAEYEATVHADDRTRVQAAMQETMRRRSDYDVEYRLQLEDGAMRWVAVTGRPTSMQSNEPLRLVGVVADITERYIAQRSLRESERLYRAIGESIEYGAWVADRQGRHLYASESFLNLIGQTQSQCAGFGWADVLRPEERHATVAAWKACVATQQSFWDREFSVRGVDGRWHPILMRGVPVKNESGDVVCWAGLHLDIAGLKRAQDEARHSEQRFRLLADTAPVLVWMSGRDKLCTFFNRPWLDFTGQTMEHELGNGWAEGVHPDDVDKCLTVYTQAFDARSDFAMDYRLRRHDGEYRWLLDRGVPLHDAGNEFSGYIGGCIDITDIKQAEVQREALLARERAARGEAERANRVKDEFLATVSHELRTPLNAILGWASLLQKQVNDPVKLKEGLTVIERNSRVQARIVDDLLDVSRVIAGKVRLDVQRVELPSVIDAALDGVRPAADAKGIRLQRVLDPLAGPVKGDPGRLQQIVWNLLSNAIKFTPRQGHVQVSLERVNSHLEITVTDSGQGIAPEFLPHIFERFRQADSSMTRAHGGLGIGLAIVKHLVEMHGGTVSAKSAGLEQGATFTVSLPVAAALQDAVDAARPREHPTVAYDASDPCDSPGLAGVRVLVVDDDPDSRALIEQLLTDCEAEVRTAASADEAIDTFAIWPPTVILSDIGMPEQDGYMLIRRIRALERDKARPTPAAALTAFTRSEDRRRALLSGYQTHVGKPVEPAELIAVVASLAGLTSSRAERPARAAASVTTAI